jgi:hypothetical protein
VQRLRAARGAAGAHGARDCRRGPEPARLWVRRRRLGATVADGLRRRAPELGLAGKRRRGVPKRRRADRRRTLARGKEPRVELVGHGAQDPRAQD